MSDSTDMSAVMAARVYEMERDDQRLKAAAAAVLRSVLAAPDAALPPAVLAAKKVLDTAIGQVAGKGVRNG